MLRPWYVRTASFTPSWMKQRGTFEVFAKSLFVFALFCDIAIQSAIEGVMAGFPGADARTDNLYLIGQSRLLIQGETETPPNFITRLNNWLTIAQDLGGDITLATAIHDYVAGNPKVRVISRNGTFTTIAEDGTVTIEQGTWDWDSVSNPERATFWWDQWIVIYPIVANGYYAQDVGVMNDGLPAGLPPSTLPEDDDLGWDHACTRAEVGAISTLVRWCKGGHVNLKSIIWSYSGTDLYAPAPVTGSPDGTWGKAFVQSTNLPSRNNTDRFWGMGADTNAW